MGIIVLVLSYVLAFLIALVTSSPRGAMLRNFRTAFLKASLFIALFVAMSTEMLSIFGAISQVFIVTSWGILGGIELVYLGALVFKMRQGLTTISTCGLGGLNNLSVAWRTALALFVITILILFFFALHDSDNYDSYTYHLARIEHWIVNKNVDFYPTNIGRQLFYSPLAEYLILHLRLLTLSMQYNLLVQYWAMLNCVVLASLIAQSLGLKNRSQFLAAILVVTLPMGIIQSTTTQNDYVVSLFLSAFVYFGIELRNKTSNSVSTLLYATIALALGALTKATFYIFSAPFCVLVGVVAIRRFGLRKSILALVLFVTMFVVVNGSFLYRNQVFFGSYLGPKKGTSMYIPSLNDKISPEVLVSNLSKNLAMHLALPNTAYNDFLKHLVIRIHKILGLPIDDPLTTFPSATFAVAFSTQQDSAGNFTHTMLILTALSFFVIRFNSKTGIVLACGGSGFAAYMLFALLLRWQPWQTRLDLPLFVVLLPLVAYFLDGVSWRLAFVSASNVIKALSIRSVTGLGLLVGGLVSIVFYYPEPIGVRNGALLVRRESDLIIDYLPSLQIANILSTEKVVNVGLAVNANGLEWQHWRLSPSLRFEHIFFPKECLTTKNFGAMFEYDAVLIDDNVLSEVAIKSAIENDLKVKTRYKVDHWHLLVLQKAQAKVFAY